MKRALLLLLSVTSIVNVGCGSNRGPGPGVIGPGGIGQYGAFSCGVPTGASPVIDSNDVDRIFNIIKEPDYLSGIPFNPVVNASGTLELHTRRFVNPNGQVSGSQIVIYGVISIDPSIYFTNFFHWTSAPYNNPNAVNIIPHCFSSLTPSGQVLPGSMESDYAGSQYKVISAYGFSEPVKAAQLPVHPGMTQYGVPGGQRFILRFARTIWPVHAPRFVNGNIAMAGDFEVYYGSSTESVYPGYQGNIRSLWQIENTN